MRLPKPGSRVKVKGGETGTMPVLIISREGDKPFDTVIIKCKYPEYNGKLGQRKLYNVTLDSCMVQ